MQSTRLLRFVLAAFSLPTLACSEDVGPCDDSVEARDTVLVGSSVQYGGQAIINQACANGGCHTSTADGAARNGAPAKMNFDLKPAPSSGEEKNSAGEKIAKVAVDDLEGLRRRQERVVAERNRIWQQVADNLMPPGGAFAMLRELTRLFDTEEGDVCTKATNESYAPITDAASKEVLRNWLACGAPIVETNSEVVTQRTAGTVGYQYPECSGGDVEGNGMDVVQTLVFDDYCVGCHPGSNDADLSDADKSYATLVEDDSDACKGKPFVTPGDLTKSYLYDLITKDAPGCHKRMPYGTDPLTAEQIKVVADWIEAGAQR